jgi:hypothetical protein
VGSPQVLFGRQIMTPSMQGIIIALLISLLIGVIVGFYLRQSRINELSDGLQQARKRNAELEQEHEQRLQEATQQLQQDYDRKFDEKVEQYQRQYEDEIARLKAQYASQGETSGAIGGIGTISPDDAYGPSPESTDVHYAVERRIRHQYEARLKEVAYKIQQAYERHLKDKLNESRDIIQQDYEQRLAEKIQYYQNEMEQRLAQSDTEQAAQLRAIATDGDPAALNTGVAASATMVAQLQEDYEARLAEKIEHYQDDYNRRVEELEREYQARVNLMSTPQPNAEDMGIASAASMPGEDMQVVETRIRQEVEANLREEYERRLAESLEQYQYELGQRTQELEQLTSRLQPEQPDNADMSFAAAMPEVPSPEPDPYTAASFDTGVSEENFDVNELPADNFSASSWSMPEVDVTPETSSEEPADSWTMPEVAATPEESYVEDTANAWAMPEVESVSEAGEEDWFPSAEASTQEEPNNLEEFLAESSEEPADSWAMPESEPIAEETSEETADSWTMPEFEATSEGLGEDWPTAQDSEETDQGFELNELLSSEEQGLEEGSADMGEPNLDDLLMNAEVETEPSADNFDLDLASEMMAEPEASSELETAESFGLSDLLDLDSGDSSPEDVIPSDEFGLDLDLGESAAPADTEGSDEFDLDFALGGDDSSQEAADSNDLDFGFALEGDAPASPESGESDEFSIDNLDDLLKDTEGEDNSEDNNFFDNLDDLNNLS